MLKYEAYIVYDFSLLLQRIFAASLFCQDLAQNNSHANIHLAMYNGNKTLFLREISTFLEDSMAVVCGLRGL